MENGHYVHYYEIEYEDGTRDVKPGLMNILSKENSHFRHYLING